MKVKDWNVAGQMTACILNIWNRCKDLAKGLGIDPEILIWLSETDEGKNALQTAVKQLAEAYSQRTKPVVLKLELGEIPTDAGGNPRYMTWFECMDWGKTLTDGWRLPTGDDKDEILNTMRVTQRAGVWEEYFWSTETDSESARAIGIHNRYPQRPVYFDKNNRHKAICVRDIPIES